MEIGSLQGSVSESARNDAKGKPEAGPVAGHPVPVPARKSSPVETRKDGEAARLQRQMEVAKKQFDDFMERYSIKMHFSIDPDLKQIVVKVLHAQTGELIRQIPTEEALKISKALDAEQGLILQQKA